ncbi:hypothetical protein OROHE_021052 [Orobanche hederae]
MFFSILCSEGRIVQVRDICSKHFVNPKKCAIILNSIPGVATRGEGLGILSLDVINLANVSALHTIALFNDLIKNTSDIVLRQRYTICSEDYDDVLYALTKAKDSVTSRNFNDMKFHVSGLGLIAEQYRSTAPGSFELRKDYEYLEVVGITLEILADYLLGKYIVI